MDPSGGRKDNQTAERVYGVIWFCWFLSFVGVVGLFLPRNYFSIFK